MTELQLLRLQEKPDSRDLPMGIFALSVVVIYLCKGESILEKKRGMLLKWQW